MPHEDCILIIVLIVFPAHADRRETEPLIEADRRCIRHPHLERHALGAAGRCCVHQFFHKDPAKAPAALRSSQSNVRHLRLLK